MKCIYCGEDMIGVSCADNPNKGYAYNIYQCEDGCDSICISHVWDNKKNIWIESDTTINVQEYK